MGTEGSGSSREVAIMEREKCNMTSVFFSGGGCKLSFLKKILFLFLDINCTQIKLYE